MQLTTWGRAGTGERGDQGHYSQSAEERPLYFDDVVQMTFRMWTTLNDGAKNKTEDTQWYLDQIWRVLAKECFQCEF